MTRIAAFRRILSPTVASGTSYYVIAVETD